MEVFCPICRKKAIWEDNPHRPFCSERCKRVDLGHWAEGNYRVPGASVEEAQAWETENL